MSERAALWEAAAEMAEAGTRFALATVAVHRGSLPMARDAKLLVTEEGRCLGTVGGGCVEADVTRQALEALQTGRPSVVRHTLNADLAGDIGLSCGGTVALFLEPLEAAPDTAALCRAVAQGIRDRRRVTVLTGLEWSGAPNKTAHVDGAVVRAGPGAPAAPGLDRAWDAALGDTYVDEAQGLFVERIRRLPRLIVFGAGHVGAAIAQLAASCGFHVLVTDDREEFANRDRVPAAHEIVVGDFGRVLDELVLDEDDYVLATTRGHSFDANVVQRTADSPARYVGMLGSKRKRAVIWKALAKAGVPDEALARVRSPIGLEIGADTPAEIAVSVVAELVRARRHDQLFEQGAQGSGR